MKHLLSICACMSGLSIYVLADADENMWQPGAVCASFATTPAGDHTFSRNGGNGALANISTVAADVVCPFPRDRFRSPGGRVKDWSLVGTGSTNWDVSKCNLFAQKWGTGFSFPASANTKHVTSGVTSISGTLSGSVYMGDGQLEILCRVPADSSIVTVQVHDL